ncbi:MAG: class IV adenylate cyclase [Thermoguttaceae bacterium]|jgi:adenylate cyclase class 2
MSYEVEQKFPVHDLTAVADRLAALGATVSLPAPEVDLYFAHPSVDFAKTDEALRLRRKGESNSLTYKGPKIDATTKTRREIELPLGPGAAALESWAALLEALGFTRVAEVHKTRRKVIVPWQGRQVEASLDDVDRVGTFVELELIAEAEGIEAAKVCLASLAQSLGLSKSERRSYLQLLLGRR